MLVYAIAALTYDLIYWRQSMEKALEDQTTFECQ